MRWLPPAALKTLAHDQPHVALALCLLAAAKEHPAIVARLETIANTNTADDGRDAAGPAGASDLTSPAPAAAGAALAAALPPAAMMAVMDAGGALVAETEVNRFFKQLTDTKDDSFQSYGVPAALYVLFRKVSPQVTKPRSECRFACELHDNPFLLLLALKPPRLRVVHPFAALLDTLLADFQEFYRCAPTLEAFRHLLPLESAQRLWPGLVKALDSPRTSLAACAC